MFLIVSTTHANAIVYDYSNTTNLPIPDGSPGVACLTPVTRTITVSDSYIIMDVDVGFIIEHTYSEDLLLSLTSPAGTDVDLVIAEVSGVDGSDFNIRFSDEASGYLLSSINQDAGNAYFDVESTLSAGSLSAFDGENAIGDWTLTLCDEFGGGGIDDTGTLFEFHLHIDGANPLIVTSIADTDTIGTLRFAINHANSNASDDDITFNITGAGPHTIALTGSLSALTDDGISIDGSTQPLSSCEQLTAGIPHDLRIYVNGSGLSINIFGIEADDVTLKGIAVGNAQAKGLFAQGVSNLTIECSYWGVEPDGITAAPLMTNAGIGSNQVQGVSNSSITNSLFSGNNDDANDIGLLIDTGTSVSFTGNIFGLTADGSAALPNGVGVQIYASSNITFGGTGTNEGNIVSGNGANGILVYNGASNVSIIGNKIGFAQDGSTEIANGAIGISITDTSSAAIFANQITKNGSLGIDLNADGVSANDDDDIDTGPSDLLNFPVINQFMVDGTTSILYDINLDVPSNTDGYRLDFYKSPGAGASDRAGEIHLGFFDVGHSGGDTDFTGSFTANEVVNVGDVISVTTTRKTGASSYNATSEFSLNYASIAPTTELSGSQTVTVYDPTSAGLYALPGNDMITALTVKNLGEIETSADSIVIIESVPPELTFYNGDIDDGGPETNPVSFSQTGGAGLTFTYATDVKFSDSATDPANFAACIYVPLSGYDADVKHICMNPKGAMAPGDPDPTVTVSYRARIN